MHTQRLTKTPTADGQVQLSGPCMVTGRVHTSPPVPVAAVEAYEAGALAQNAFPMLSEPEREFLISGTSPEGWRALFGPRGQRCEGCGE